MNLKYLLNIKNIFSFIINLKRYISFNLFSLIGWFDFIFFLLLYSYSKSDTSGLSFVFYGAMYIATTRILYFIFLLCFNGVKIKQNKFIDNKIYNIFFLMGLIYFFVTSLIILISIISVFVVILLFY